MKLQDKVGTLFNIRPGEGPLIRLVMLFAIFAFLADSFFVTTAYTLFLTTFDSSAISYIYVGIGAVGILASFFYLRAANRFGLIPTVLGSRMVLFLLLAVIWLSVRGEATPWLLAALPVLQGVYQSQANTSFWNVAGRLFDLQQAKRLFGLIGASGTIGYMFGGIFAPLFIRLWGTVNLLGFALLAMGLSLAAGFLIAKRYADRLEVPTNQIASEVTPQPEPASKRPFWQTTYVLQMIAGYTCFVITYHFIEALFYSRAESIFPSEVSLASFLAVFGAVVSLSGLLVETLGTGRILTRLGVPGLVLLSPVILISLTTLNTVVGLFSVSLLALFILITLAYFAENILNAVDYVAIGVLYQPLPSEQRTTVQTFMDGVIGPTATGLSGLLLLVILRFFDQSAVLPILLPLLLVWVFVAGRIARSYPEQLKQALRDRVLQGTQRMPLDATGLSILQASLSETDPGPVIYALDVWQQLEPDQLQKRLPALLEHPSPLVQLDVLSRIELLTARTALPAVQQLAEKAATPSLRGAAWRVLIAVGGVPEEIETLGRLMEVAEPEVRHGMMIGLLRSGELDGVLTAGDSLSVLLRSEQTEDRIFAARVLGESGLQSVYRPILRLLDDTNPQVQRAALYAAGQLNHPRLWPLVIAALGRPLVRATAVSALVNGRKGVLPALEVALFSEETMTNPEVMLRLARICGRLRLPELANGLLPLIDYPDDFVRTEAVLALQAIGYKTSKDQATTQIQRELAQAAWLLAALVDLQEGDSARLAAVRAALTESLDRLLRRLFGWLSLGYDPAAVGKARDGLGISRWSSGTVAAEQQAYALEMLELIVERKIFAELGALLSDVPPARRLEHLLPMHPQPTLPQVDRLAAIVGGNATQFTPWLRSIALFAWQELTDKPGATLLTTTADANRLVRETAVLGTRQHDSANNPQLGEFVMLVTIEKVMLLKVVELFSETPDEILVEVAERLHEIVFPAGSTIFEQGERGDSLYIIIDGNVEVFSGKTILDRLGPRQLFGEMALLDAEPRAASVRTVTETRLLRLDQDAFYELMDDRIEIAYGVIRVIVKRLRMNMLEVTRLNKDPNTPLPHTPLAH